MNEIVKAENQAPAAVEPAGFKLGQWLGRREAFGLMAGPWSAAEIESVRQYGPAFFTVRQLTHPLSRSINSSYQFARHITDQGVNGCLTDLGENLCEPLFCGADWQSGWAICGGLLIRPGDAAASQPASLAWPAN